MGLISRIRSSLSSYSRFTYELNRILTYVRMSFSPSFWRSVRSSFKLWRVLMKKGRVLVPQPIFKDGIEVEYNEIQGFFYITGDVTIEIAQQIEHDEAHSEKFVAAFRSTIDNMLFLPNVILTFAIEVATISGVVWQWDTIMSWFT